MEEVIEKIREDVLEKLERFIQKLGRVYLKN